MDGEMDWIAARFVLSAIMGVHPLVAVDDAGADDEHFPVDDAAAVHGHASPPPVALPAAVLAPEEVAGAVVCAVCNGGGCGAAGPWCGCPCGALVPRRLHRAVAADQDQLPDLPRRAAAGARRRRLACPAAPGGGGDSRQPPAAGGVVYDARRHVAQLINHHRSID
ncbi:hypothetical protein OsJ_28487 [Oryza sativa Japonica Group]|uniref:Uncharacterized protein n=1 Tax=Oryza sativa subsp. japonica TaxID=39947 RepID=A3BWD0_ORYSJ|nr:hypothetical protein OsJ_28487 [Oryza sativa Japonica Group]